MKTELKFVWDDENGTSEADEEIKLINNRRKMAVALWDIQQEIFRPARKHGYSDPRLNKLLESTKIVTDKDGDSYAMGYEIVGLLEEKFHQILEQHGIELD